MSSSLSDIWSELHADATAPHGFARRRVWPEAPCGLFLASEKPANQPAVLVELDTQAVPADIHYPQSAGFSLVAHPIDPGPSGRVRLVLQVTSTNYVDIFLALVDDVVSSVAVQPDQRRAVGELVARLAKWQAFLQKHDPAGLDSQAQLGLYGELWLLRRLIELDALPQGEVVSGWLGPAGTHQDFQFGRAALEAKTTRAKAPDMIQIASERQLDDAGFGALVLFHLSVDTRPSRAATLPELVAEIRQDLQGTVAATVFNDRLVEAGYLDGQRDRYDGTGYVVLGAKYYRVEEGFPRIVTDDVPTGVGDVHYCIVPGACESHLLDELAAIDLIRGQANA